ncbi:FecR protein [Daejeonella rubra]|uniref:FecR protein n=1 Tax=Daejeonella rubra TaxID=990371 RepID=A0A1G9TVZ9_9SPHI|nr:FecR domain-containing protein [Daejeonella rubra]SDM51916.1 FecR protein [Daejeonella rubra]
MHENRIVELLTRKIAGEATPDELGELSYLLTKYPDAVYYEALLEQVWDLGHDSGQEDLEEAFEKHKLNNQDDLDFETKGKSFYSFFKSNVLLLTTAVLIIFSTSLYFSKYYHSSNKVVRVDIYAGKGIRKEVKLPDGTFVRLNSDSKLSYDLDMQRHDQRDVSLTGEAFFKVAHDKKRPFIVKTNKVAIKVLGTEFNVRDYPGDKVSETTLIKGSIELTINDRSDQKFLLKPSEKLALVKSSKKTLEKGISSVLMIDNISPIKLGDQEYIEEISWTENKFVFENESFEDLIPKLERWYNVKIILNDTTIKSYRFTGVFIKENIIQALEAMQLIKSFHYKLNENEVKIY